MDSIFQLPFQYNVKSIPSYFIYLFYYSQDYSQIQQSSAQPILYVSLHLRRVFSVRKVVHTRELDSLLPFVEK